MLTQSELKEKLHYNPETGIFTWLLHRSKRGETAGSITNKKYAVVGIGLKQYAAHRLAWLYMYGVWPKDQIDHINHVRDDNRISNLREASHKENGKNQSIKKSNNSGVTGVYWAKIHKKWYAQIRVNGKNKHLGCFDAKEDAILCREKANTLYGFHERHGQ